jgi:hypothetical protein
MVSNNIAQIIHIPGGRVAANPFDFYDTPRHFISAVLDILPSSFSPTKILDPGAGGGGWGYMARYKWPASHIEGIEIREDVVAPPTGIYDVWRTMDFRQYVPDSSFDLVVGNPPYSIVDGKRDNLLAEKFIRTGLEAVRENGLVFYLLKTVFLEGSGRGLGLFTEMPPNYMFQSISRIPFRPDLGNKTNAVAYCMMLWQKGNVASETKIRWFDWRLGGKLEYVRDYPALELK